MYVCLTASLQRTLRLHTHRNACWRRAVGKSGEGIGLVGKSGEDIGSENRVQKSGEIIGSENQVNLSGRKIGRNYRVGKSGENVGFENLVIFQIRELGWLGNQVKL